MANETDSPISERAIAAAREIDDDRCMPKPEEQARIVMCSCGYSYHEPYSCEDMALWAKSRQAAIAAIIERHFATALIVRPEQITEINLGNEPWIKVVLPTRASGGLILS